MTDTQLEIVDITKSFDGKRALKGISLSVDEGEFFTLLGPSGCGKTTLLKIIAGLERPDTGEIRYRGTDVSNQPPEKRPFNMVFQSYALFPHMSVAENIAYGLSAEGVARDEIGTRVAEMLNMVRLEQFADRSVGELSGGQRQRVALGRALIKRPPVLLLDEPLGALDLQLRKQLQKELRLIKSQTDTAFIFVTHDQEEALALSTRIALMDQGQVVQLGSPREIYEHPVNQFAAGFVGESNIVRGHCTSIEGDRASVRFETDRVLDVSVTKPVSVAAGSEVMVLLRPEDIGPCQRDAGHFSGVISDSTFLGSHWLHNFASSAGSELVFASKEELYGGQDDIEIEAGSGVLLGTSEEERTK